VPVSGLEQEYSGKRNLDGRESPVGFTIAGTKHEIDW
jgi:hypothetical protein